MANKGDKVSAQFFKDNIGEEAFILLGGAAASSGVFVRSMSLKIDSVSNNNKTVTFTNNDNDKITLPVICFVHNSNDQDDLFMKFVPFRGFEFTSYQRRFIENSQDISGSNAKSSHNYTQKGININTLPNGDIDFEFVAEMDSNERYNVENDILSQIEPLLYKAPILYEEHTFSVTLEGESDPILYGVFNISKLSQNYEIMLKLLEDGGSAETFEIVGSTMDECLTVMIENIETLMNSIVFGWD